MSTNELVIKTNPPGTRGPLQSVSHHLARHFIDAILVATVSLIGLFLFLALWGPDANQLDKWALELERQNDNGVRQELIWKAALLWRQIFLGPSNPEVAHGLTDLGRYYLATKQWDKAEDVLKQALAFHESMYNKEHTLADRKNIAHVDFLESLVPLTTLYIQQSRYSDAAPLLKRQYAAMLEATRTPVEYITLYQQQTKQVRPHVPPETMPPKEGAFRSKVWYASLAKAVNTWKALKLAPAQYLYEKDIRNRVALYEIGAWFNFELGKLAESEEQQKKAIEVVRTSPVPLLDQQVRQVQLTAVLDAEGKYKEEESIFSNLLSEINSKTLAVETEDLPQQSAKLIHGLALHDYADLARKLGRNDQFNELEKQATTYDL